MAAGKSETVEAVVQLHCLDVMHEARYNMVMYYMPDIYDYHVTPQNIVAWLIL
jgi:hypothetical protein